MSTKAKDGASYALKMFYYLASVFILVLDQVEIPSIRFLVVLMSGMKSI